MLLYRILYSSSSNQHYSSRNQISRCKCNGDSTGSARFTVGNFASTSSYSYTVNGVATAGQTATSFTLTNLAAGSYAVLLLLMMFRMYCYCYSNHCTTYKRFYLLSITSNINANCNVATATVTVGASGGTQYTDIHL
jgi:hypothetical protein